MTESMTEHERREAWLADRQKHITGTDVAAILGLSPWKSPIHVYLDKKGLAEPQPENDAMRWGRRLERPILEAYSEEVGEPLAFSDPYALLECPALPILGASLDARWAEKDQRPVDAKNTRSRNGYGEPGSAGMPLHYRTQLAVQMAVTGAPSADLAVLFAGQSLEYFHVERDPEVESMILESVDGWWKRHILGEEAPEVDGSKASADYLQQKFQQHGAELLPASNEAQVLARDLARLKATATQYEDEIKLHENRLKDYIGEAAGIDGICTWKKSKGRKEVAWEAAYMDLISRVEQDRNQPVRKLAEQVLETHTSMKPGSRRFLLTYKEEK